MILKRGQSVEGLQIYVRESRLVKAKKMTEDFMIESGTGWQSGRRGDWLVEIANDLLTAMEEKQFQNIFRLYVPGRDCIGPCDGHPPRRLKYRGK